MYSRITTSPMMNNIHTFFFSPKCHAKLSWTVKGFTNINKCSSNTRQMTKARDVTL